MPDKITPPKGLDADQLFEWLQKQGAGGVPAEKDKPKDEYYFPNPSVGKGTNDPADMIVGGPETGPQESYYFPPSANPQNFAALDKEGKYSMMEKAAEVSASARAPEEIDKEEESLKKQLIAGFNRQKMMAMAPGPMQREFQLRGGFDAKIDPSMSLADIIKATEKSYTGKTPANIRDKADALRMERALGAVDFNPRKSILSNTERLAIKSLNPKDQENYIRSLEGIELLANDPDLGYIIKRNGRIGVADERGASFGDVVEILPAVADGVITAIGVSGSPQSGGTTFVASQAAKKAFFSKLRNWLGKTATRRTVGSGVIEGGSQATRELAAQQALLDEEDRVATGGDIAKDAGVTGLIGGGFQGVGEVAVAGAKTVRGGTKEASEEAARIKRAEDARESLGIEAPLTKADMNPTLAKVEATVARMPGAGVLGPLTGNLHENYIRLFEDVSSVIRKNTKGARTIAEIEEELAQNAGKIPSQKKVVDDAAEGVQKAEGDLATAEAQSAAKKSEALDEYGQSASSARDALERSALGVDGEGGLLREDAMRQSQSLMRGKAQESFLDPVASRLIGGRSIDQATTSNPQAVFESLQGAAEQERNRFQRESKKKFKKVYGHPEANEPIFDISSIREVLGDARKGLRDEDGNILSGLSADDLGGIEQLLKVADQKQTLADLVSFRQQIYDSIGNDKIFGGISNGIKKKVGAEITQIIYNQAEEVGSKQFSKDLRAANKHYKNRVDDFYNYGVNTLFADATKRQGGYLDRLVREVGESGAKSQTYSDLVRLLGIGSKSLEGANEAISNALVKSAYDNSTGAININKLIDSVDSLNKIDPELSKKLGFDATMINSARSAVKAFAGTGEVDADLLAELLQRGIVEGNENIATDVTNILAVSRLRRENLANGIEDLLAGDSIVDPNIRRKLRDATGSERDKIAKAEDKVREVIRKESENVSDKKSVSISAKDRLEAEELALKELESDAYLQAIRGDKLVDGSESYKNLYNKVFSADGKGRSKISPKTLERIIADLEVTAAGTNSQADAAQSLLDDIRRRTRLDLYEKVRGIPSNVVGARAEELKSEGIEAYAVNASDFVKRVRSDKESREHLRIILGDGFELEEQMADALAPVARKESASGGVASMTEKTAIASTADDPVKAMETIASIWAMSVYLARGDSKIWRATKESAPAQKAGELAGQALDSRTARVAAQWVTSLTGSQAAQAMRDLEADYGTEEAKKIYSAIETIAAQEPTR
jgi:hypothetical protein